jgi:hypothetical protein
MRRWKELLGKADCLNGQSNGIAYDRIKLLVEIYNDLDYRSDMAAQYQVDAASDDQLVALLDERLANDLGAFWDQPFHEGRAMLDLFPERSTWVSGKIRDLHAQMLEKATETDRTETRNRPHYKAETAKLKDENAELRDKVKVIETQTAKVESEIETLRRENVELRSENEVLRIKVDQLTVDLSEARAAIRGLRSIPAGV